MLAYFVEDLTFAINVLSINGKIPRCAPAMPVTKGQFGSKLDFALSPSTALSPLRNHKIHPQSL
jgi:hypothetical protein